MKINWKVRFKNKVWLITVIGALISFVYQILGLFDIVPTISQDSLLETAHIMLNILAAVGILIDPTTPGIEDSDRAMSYIEPGGLKKDE